MSTQKNEHNPDGLPEMEEFRFLCIGEHYKPGDEFWSRRERRWINSTNYMDPDMKLGPNSATFRRRITPLTDTAGSGREGETPTPIMDACYDKHVHYSDQIALFAVLKQGKELERRLSAALNNSGTPTDHVIDRTAPIETQLAQAEAWIAQLQQSYLSIQQTCAKKDQALSAALAEVEGLRADKARLDWLEKNAVKELKIDSDGTEVQLDRWHRKYITSHSWTGPTLRAAIDSAQRQEGR